MEDTLNERVGVLNRREIEARILLPFYQAVRDELGEAKARSLLAKVVVDAATDAGRAMRPDGSETDLEAFSEAWEPWTRGGALEIVEHRRDADVWRFDVVRCRYAELYRELGMAELGATLSCARDAALIDGYDPDVTFERTQTLMEGADHCDFSFRRHAPRPSNAEDD